jgi:hypothetical protein
VRKAFAFACDGAGTYGDSMWVNGSSASATLSPPKLLRREREEKRREKAAAANNVSFDTLSAQPALRRVNLSMVEYLGAFSNR